MWLANESKPLLHIAAEAVRGDDHALVTEDMMQVYTDTLGPGTACCRLAQRSWREIEPRVPTAARNPRSNGSEAPPWYLRIRRDGSPGGPPLRNRKHRLCREDQGLAGGAIL